MALHLEFSGEHTCTCTGVTDSTDGAPRTRNESMYLPRVGFSGGISCDVGMVAISMVFQVELLL